MSSVWRQEGRGGKEGVSERRGMEEGGRGKEEEEGEAEGGREEGENGDQGGRRKRPMVVSSPSLVFTNKHVTSPAM